MDVGEIKAKLIADTSKWTSPQARAYSSFGMLVPHSGIHDSPVEKVSHKAYSSSAIRLARIAHPVSSRKKYLAVFIAYFDESGDPSQTGAFTLGGLVAKAWRWDAFEGKWSRILRRFNLPMFHMSEFESRQGIYASLSNPERIELVATLAGIIKGTIEFGFSHSLVVKDWKKVIEPTIVNSYEQPRGHYIFLLQSCMEEIVRFISLPAGERVACIFDRNGFMAGSAIKHFDDLVARQSWEGVFDTITFGDKTRLIPLQAADMVAYEGYKHTVNQEVERSNRPERELFKNLLAARNIHVGWYGERNLQEFLRKVAALSDDAGA
jgi:hypothetical protein